MVIEISATVFKCEGGKHVFFSRLYELANFDSVIYTELNLRLVLTEPCAQEILMQLQEICNMWGASFEILKTGHISDRLHDF